MPDPKQTPTVAERMAELLASFADPSFRTRYGVGADEKYTMALTGQIPGAMPVTGNAQIPIEERRAAGYLFGQRWPSVGVPLTQLSGMVRAKFGEDPLLGWIGTQAAQEGARSGYSRQQVEQALADQRKQQILAEFARQYQARMSGGVR